MQDKIYRTSDTTLAAFLIVQKFYLIGIDYGPVRFEYSFSLSPEIQECANDYVAGNALTDPATFARVNKKLLRIIGKRCQWEED